MSSRRKRHLALLSVKVELAQYWLDQPYVTSAKKAVITAELAFLQSELENLLVRRPTRKEEEIYLGFRAGSLDSTEAEADLALPLTQVPDWMVKP
jgi:hypothetical protein